MSLTHPKILFDLKKEGNPAITWMNLEEHSAKGVKLDAESQLLHDLIYM